MQVTERMRRPRAAATLAVATGLLASALGGYAPPTFAATPAAASTRTSSVVVGAVGIGAGRGEIGVEEGDGGIWGASSFAIGPDGAFHIVDGVNDKLLVLNADGTLRGERPLPEPLVAPTDIAVTARGTYLLDVAAQPGRVCKLAEDGSIARSWIVPDAHAATHAVTGISVQEGDSEDIFLELDGSWMVPFVAEGAAVSPKTLPLVRRGNRADVASSSSAAFGIRGRRAGLTYATFADWAGGRSGTIVAAGRDGGERRLEVRTAGALGRLKGLDRDRAGHDFVLVDEVPPALSHADCQIREFSGQAEEIARYHVPVERFTWWPDRYVRLAPEGEVYCLVPQPGRVTIERLTPEAPATAVVPDPVPAARAAATKAPTVWAEGLARLLGQMFEAQRAYAIWDRVDASDRAWAYVNNSWYCSSANYARSCGDTRPAYITSSGKNYSSVPYCWGGFDTAGTFNAAMADGDDAGDVNCSGSKRWCTAGVDCSGFVSRLWGLGTKRSTSSLDDVAYPIGRTSMNTADLYLWPGHHAIAFRYFTSAKDSAVWESTTSSDKDRVVAWTRTAAYLADPSHYYGTWRYDAW